jgi:hypothetical protein
MNVRLANWYSFAGRNFHRCFWPLLVAVCVIGFVRLQDRVYLQNDAAPHGILSLELGRSYQTDTAIIQSWKKDVSDPVAADLCETHLASVDRLRIARSDVRLDYLFIVVYTLLGLVIIAALQMRIQQKGSAFSNILLGLVVLAGLCDGAENIGLLRFIRDGLYSTDEADAATTTVTHISAFVKFISLSIVVFYVPFVLIVKDRGLIRLSGYVRDKSQQLFRYRVILIGVLAFAVPIWMMDQGQDLLINSNSGDAGIWLFMAVVVIAALLNWWLAKLFFERTYKGPVFPLKEPILSDPVAQASEKKVSRYLGVCTILLPAVAILNALVVIRIHYPLDLFPPLFWLVALLALFFVLIKEDVAGRGYRWIMERRGRKYSARLTMTLLVVLAFGLPGILRWVVLTGQQNTPWSLIFLFFHLILVAFAFYIFVSTRTYMFPSTGWLGRRIGIPIILAGSLLAVLFILFNIFPLSVLSLQGCYLSLPVLLSGIIFYILLITLLIRISLWKNINFLLLVVLTGLVISITSNNDYHSVKRMEIKAAAPPVALDDYFRQWLLSRQGEIDSTEGNYPVFLVNSYGGGIRAAAFTNMVFSYLDSVFIRQGKAHKGFEHFVFSVSGASGGTVGAAVQCAYRARHGDISSDAYALDSIVRFYRHDYLTPVLSNMLGSDIWASATSCHLWRDRSEIQEALWEGFGREDLHISLDQPFDALWDTGRSNPARYEVPLLFSNTLNVDDGWKGICAPVVLEHGDFPATHFIRERLDSFNANRVKGRDSLQAISLMTGAFLSARFPFISPSGKMGPGFHFMDGGAKDNSGASTSENIFIAIARSAIRQMAREDDTISVYTRLMQKVRFYFLSISNQPYAAPDERHLVSNRFEPISPMVGIINSGINGNAEAADNTLRLRYAKDSALLRGFCSDYCSVWPSAFCISNGKGAFYCPVLPLGWQISAPSLQRLRASFTPDQIRYYNPSGLRKVLAIMQGH